MDSAIHLSYNITDPGLNVARGTLNSFVPKESGHFDRRRPFKAFSSIFVSDQRRSHSVLEFWKMISLAACTIEKLMLVYLLIDKLQIYDSTEFHIDTKLL